MIRVGFFFFIPPFPFPFPIPHSPYLPYRLFTPKLVSPYMRLYLLSHSLLSLLSQTPTHANAPVDIAAASSRNISVSHTPGAVDDATATVGAFLTISCLRNFSLAERNGREGKWKSGWEPARDPEGRTVGIVGMGGIGQVSLSILFGLSARVRVGHLDDGDMPGWSEPSCPTSPS